MWPRTSGWDSKLPPQGGTQNVPALCTSIGSSLPALPSNELLSLAHIQFDYIPTKFGAVWSIPFVCVVGSGLGGAVAAKSFGCHFTVADGFFCNGLLMPAPNQISHFRVGLNLKIGGPRLKPE